MEMGRVIRRTLLLDAVEAVLGSGDTCVQTEGLPSWKAALLWVGILWC